MSNIIRKVSPLGYRILVEVKEQEKSDGGIYLPAGKDGSKDAAPQLSLLAEVLEVATANDDETEEEENISGIPWGAMILIPANAGIKVPWNHSLRIVESQDVLAVIEEMEMV